MATTTRTFQNYIGGEWIDAASGGTFNSTSPADGELIGTFPRSSAEDVDRAVAAATAAFEEWRLVPAPKRGEMLFRFAQLVTDAKPELTDLMTHEMGKVKAESGGDVQEAIDMSYYMGGEGRRLFGQTTPSELRNKFQMSVRMPIGVIGVITPWNFPIAIPSWKIAPALVAGNTVVFKPATDTPALGQRFTELLIEAGVPDGVVNIVHGGGGAVGERLVRHPDVRVISLTGSRETGVKVLEAAAEGLKHVHLELGGKNAIIVMDDADLDLALDGILWSAFGTSGQRCTATSRVIVHERLYDTLAARLVERAEALRLGPGWEDDSDVGPVINGAALEKIHSYTQIGRDDGATLLTGGEVADEGELAKGFYYRPTIFGDVQPDMRIAQEEIFGPTLSLIRFRDETEAFRISNGVRYGLSSSIFTRDVNRAFRAMRDLEAGITYVNAGTTGAEVHLPFGGTKETGNGHREAGQAALDVFTEWKSVYVDYSGTLQRAQIDNTE
ncbi:MAG TPA: aldehyde dehydrogenase family protein [Gaiellaceae bacterium]|nr:aldehyde dehydrogenase family protein [Gaiellaceae bacterium]